MEVIPAIDIVGGRCVRLLQGDYSRQTVYDDDPTAVARRFQAAGAARLHVVDLDGAKEGRPVGRPYVEAVLKAVSVPVQVGGGIRNLDDLSAYLEAGAYRCVLGTAAVEDEAFLEEALARFPERVAVAVDAREGRVATRGWLQEAAVSPVELLERLLGLGARCVIYTDVLRDGTLSRPNLAAIARLLERAKGKAPGVEFICAGGISSLDDLLALARLGVDGAIVGRALYTGDLDLREALAALAEL
ncbi:MAG: 1-(5-phosphoribosyl)-5-[(5-phosphoribosylamino)methylideneamino]imidazole-4-carboxamide isomerase [Dehalococcoidia bacterium]|nr:1-(5-phosphoribosyl)-5-[(5-phosphoribosylamino)methylideneamino]imidazole-4-carboxamide isomerase [Dehalococcoidia bacterium]MDW8009909.1 1-(5-phosphoribosyl)-5-[(5-phosphoribosylamino)methylideneamino]imidazole-4-carboxamide isomerase [Chloroflexota bacterium]